MTILNFFITISCKIYIFIFLKKTENREIERQIIERSREMRENYHRLIKEESEIIRVIRVLFPEN